MLKNRFAKVVVALMLMFGIMTQSSVARGECDPAWLPTFGGPVGASGIPFAMTVFDDGLGGGPALYVGGLLTSVENVAANGIIKWDGMEWSPLGSGVFDRVHALAVFDDGTGPALYAGGIFVDAGGETVNHIARWDGHEWSKLGVGGVSHGSSQPEVNALVVHDDGSGPALYVGGRFTSAGDRSANNIARWDGREWSAVGSGVNHRVEALTVFEDGSPDGVSLIVGGQFTTAGGSSANRVARWDGASWSPLGSGFATGTTVRALAVFDDGSGSGPALYAGGAFSGRIARWNGAGWLVVGGGLTNEVRVLKVFDDGQGNGPALYAGGSFSGRLSKWNGETWTIVGGGTNGVVYALGTFADGSSEGPSLYVGGSFVTAGDVAVNNIAKWNAAEDEWSAFGSGVSNSVGTLAVFDDGTGPALYAGGQFLSAGGESVSRIGRWDPVAGQWSPLGSGTNGNPLAMTAFDDGPGGPALYVGGNFMVAGDIPAPTIARWDGSEWSSINNSSNAGVASLAVFDDGNGRSLYAGGGFTVFDGTSIDRIARWDGEQWWPVAGGVNDVVWAMREFDDGSGSALYVGGTFTTAGGQAANYIARWDGQQWSPLGSGMNDAVFALEVFDDGSGPSLYAAGLFTMAGGVSANHIARWNGASEQWEALGTGVAGGPLPRVRDMAVFDDGTGSGPALYVAGRFAYAGGQEISHLAKWNGREWSSAGSGVSNKVLTMTVFDDGLGGGPALYAGGFFRFSDAGDAYLTRLQGCDIEPSCEPADLNCDGVVDVSDLLILLAAWGPCPEGTTCPADLNSDGAVDVSDLLILLANWE